MNQYCVIKFRKEELLIYNAYWLVGVIVTTSCSIRDTPTTLDNKLGVLSIDQLSD